MKTVDEKLHEIIKRVIFKVCGTDEAITKIRKIIEIEAFAKSADIVERVSKFINDDNYNIAIKLLKDLYDLQNGSPLPTYYDEWNKVMDEIDEFLTRLENEKTD